MWIIIAPRARSYSCLPACRLIKPRNGAHLSAHCALLQLASARLSDDELPMMPVQSANCAKWAGMAHRLRAPTFLAQIFIIITIVNSAKCAKWGGGVAQSFKAQRDFKLSFIVRVIHVPFPVGHSVVLSGSKYNSQQVNAAWREGRALAAGEALIARFFASRKVLFVTPDRPTDRPTE